MASSCKDTVADQERDILSQSEDENLRDMDEVNEKEMDTSSIEDNDDDDDDGNSASGNSYTCIPVAEDSKFSWSDWDNVVEREKVKIDNNLTNIWDASGSWASGARKARIGHLSENDLTDVFDNMRICMAKSGEKDGIHIQTVVGAVQSGKTEAMNTAVVHALDLGFRVIVVLGGATDNLRSQTQQRVEGYLSDAKKRSDNPTNKNITWLTDRDHDLVQFLKKKKKEGHSWDQLVSDVEERRDSVVMVIKKNNSQLKQLFGLFFDVDEEDKAALLPEFLGDMLILDDESDAGTVNSGKDENHGATPCYRSLVLFTLQWKEHLKGKIVLMGFTATPWANQLSALDSPHYSHFFWLLKPAKSYVGIHSWFGQGEGTDSLSDLSNALVKLGASDFPTFEPGILQHAAEPTYLEPGTGREVGLEGRAKNIAYYFDQHKHSAPEWVLKFVADVVITGILRQEFHRKKVVKRAENIGGRLVTLGGLDLNYENAHEYLEAVVPDIVDDLLLDTATVFKLPGHPFNARTTTERILRNQLFRFEAKDFLCKSPLTYAQQSLALCNRLLVEKYNECIEVFCCLERDTESGLQRVYHKFFEADPVLGWSQRSQKDIHSILVVRCDGDSEFVRLIQLNAEQREQVSSLASTAHCGSRHEPDRFYHAGLVNIDVRIENIKNMHHQLEMAKGAVTDDVLTARLQYFKQRMLALGVNQPFGDKEIITKARAILKNELKIVEVHSQKGSDAMKELKYDDPKFPFYPFSIVVGCNLLSRGVTIQGLTVSAFLLASASSITDRMTQFSRWCGHKWKEELSLITLYTGDPQIALFQKTIIPQIDNMRTEIRKLVINDWDPTEHPPNFLVAVRNKLTRNAFTKRHESIVLPPFPVLATTDEQCNETWKFFEHLSKSEFQQHENPFRVVFKDVPIHQLLAFLAALNMNSLLIDELKCLQSKYEALWHTSTMNIAFVIAYPSCHKPAEVFIPIVNRLGVLSLTDAATASASGSCMNWATSWKALDVELQCDISGVDADIGELSLKSRYSAELAKLDTTEEHVTKSVEVTKITDAVGSASDLDSCDEEVKYALTRPITSPLLAAIMLLRDAEGKIKAGCKLFCPDIIEKAKTVSKKKELEALEHEAQDSGLNPTLVHQLVALNVARYNPTEASPSSLAKKPRLSQL